MRWPSPRDQLIQQIIADTDTGTNPRRDLNGLDVSLHVNEVPTGEAITVLWRG
ncbi:hypothetical protein [Arthrobacter sp. S2(2024)]|uniref:hypothetical protein n=1 Tax=Arthrobacter sp. S2(2024) TaxID=3111911 RepID=UPI002FC5AB95